MVPWVVASSPDRLWQVAGGDSPVHPLYSTTLELVIKSQGSWCFVPNQPSGEFRVGTPRSIFIAHLLIGLQFRQYFIYLHLLCDPSSSSSLSHFIILVSLVYFHLSHYIHVQEIHLNLGYHLSKSYYAFSVEINTILGYSQVKCYIDIFYALRNQTNSHKKYLHLVLWVRSKARGSKQYGPLLRCS